MSETDNISKMADLVASKIFEVFGWQRIGPSNQNWSCVEQEKHGKRKIQTHPSDVVFKYHDAFTGLDQYITLDLKSLGADSISPGLIARSLKSLSHSAECGLKSESWQRLYLEQDDNPVLAGLLFVYNHDLAYDKSFDLQLARIPPSKIDVSATYRLYAIGPQRVNYLATVANDILMLRGSGRLPSLKCCSFHYPDLTTQRPAKQSATAAAIETLLGPWLLLRYEDTNSACGTGKGLIVYYDGRGESEDEFQYLFDYLFRYQLVDGATQIQVRVAAACSEAMAFFNRAKQQYLSNYWSIMSDAHSQSAARMRMITYEGISSQVQKFSEIELGFKHA